MLQIRVYGSAGATAVVADRLGALAGAQHVSVADGARGGEIVLPCGVRKYVLAVNRADPNSDEFAHPTGGGIISRTAV